MGNLAHLNKYFYKHSKLIIPGIFFVILSNLFAIFSAQILRQAVDLIAEYLWLYKISYQFDEYKIMLIGILSSILIGFSLLYFVFHLFKGAFLFLMRQTIIVASRHIEYELKNEIYQHIQNLPLSFFKMNKTGDIMTRITEDVSRVRMYVGPAFMYSINLVFLIIITISIMFYVNLELSLYTLIPLPVLAYTIYRVSHLIHIKSDIIQKQLSKLNTLALEAFSGIRLIKAFNQEYNFNINFEKASEDYKNKSLNLTKVEAFFFPLVTLLIGLSTIITILIGGYQVINGKISYGNIVEFVYYINLLTWPVTALGWIASIIQRADVSQGRINDFLNEIPYNKENGHIGITQIKGNILLKGVSFTYPETGINAIKNLNLRIKSGAKVALVGKTGSGKSTIAQLLLKMYHPNEGYIKIDGNNIEAIKSKNYRDRIGYVPQDYFLFSDSIKNNISFGTNKDDTKIIKQNAILASVHTDIMGFESQYDTHIGERGITLSGGQKQRICLARALIKQPDLLILDDCLSAVDTETEYHILKNLQDVFAQKTVVFITHRVLSLKNMDRIIVMNDGCIVEEGRFDKLMRSKGLFYDFHEQQKLKDDLNNSI